MTQSRFVTRLLLTVLLIAPLSACYTMQKGMTDHCDAAQVQRYVGIAATAESGRELMGISGAKTLRWVAPDMAVTADFVADRLTVVYDNTRKITQISCG
jgi:hypothetical protein